MIDHNSKIRLILEKRNKRGNIIARESKNLEFKEKFNFADIAEYLRIMASFANTIGGYIIFGIKDDPRKFIGVDFDKFESIKQEKVTTFLLEYFAPEIKWDIGLVEIDVRYIGYIYTYESDIKPVICKKNKDNTLKNGEIYYRYKAQTRTIEYAELRKIINEIENKINNRWLNLFKDIAKIGPENAVINLKSKSKVEIKPSSSPKALPVNLKEGDIRKFWPWDFYQLTESLRNRYINFKANQDYYRLKKKLEDKKEYCYPRELDPGNPKSAIKKFYSPRIFKEFDKYYKKK